MKKHVAKKHFDKLCCVDQSTQQNFSNCERRNEHREAACREETNRAPKPSPASSPANSQASSPARSPLPMIEEVPDDQTAPLQQTQLPPAVAQPQRLLNSCAQSAAAKIQLRVQEGLEANIKAKAEQKKTEKADATANANSKGKPKTKNNAKVDKTAVVSKRPAGVEKHPTLKRPASHAMEDAQRKHKKGRTSMEMPKPEVGFALSPMVAASADTLQGAPPLVGHCALAGLHLCRQRGISEDANMAQADVSWPGLSHFDVYARGG